MGGSIDFEVWREHRREILREADERRLAREARRGRRSRPSGIVRGLASNAGVMRWPSRESSAEPLRQYRGC